MSDKMGFIWNISKYFRAFKCREKSVEMFNQRTSGGEHFTSYVRVSQS